jgi:hypothetical protein
MRRFFIRFMIILLPFLVVFLVIEYKASRLPNSYAQKKHSLREQAQAINVLVLGSSHAFDDINPDFFSCKGYNLSNVSQSHFYDTRLCLNYLDRLPHLKGVIVTVSYFSLFYELNDLPEGWRDYFYYRYFGIRYPSLDLSDPKIFSYTALYTRDFISAMVFSKLNNKDEFGDIQPNGWKKVPAPSDSNAISDSTGHEHALFHNSLVRMKNLKANVRYLRELLTELHKRNIRVCFVTPPVYQTYSRYLNPFILQANQNIIRELCREFNAEYFNYFNDPLFLKSDFSDNDHLNIAGAEKFSRILDRDFVSKCCNR